MHAWWALTALCVATGACVLLDFDDYAVDGSGGEPLATGGGGTGGTGGMGGGTGGSTKIRSFGVPMAIHSGSELIDVVADGDRVYWLTPTELHERSLAGQDETAVPFVGVSVAVGGDYLYLATIDTTAGNHPLWKRAADAQQPTPLFLTFDPGSSPNDMAVLGNDLLVAAGDQIHWVVLPEGVDGPPPDTVGDKIGNFTANDGGVYGFSGDSIIEYKDGVLRDVPLPGGVPPSAIAVNMDWLYLASDNGVDRYPLTAFDAGMLSNPDEISDIPASCVAASDAQLFVVSVGGVLRSMPAAGGANTALDGTPFPKCTALLLVDDGLFIWYDADNALHAVPFAN